MVYSLQFLLSFLVCTYLSNLSPSPGFCNYPSHSLSSCWLPLSHLLFSNSLSAFKRICECTDKVALKKILIPRTSLMWRMSRSSYKATSFFFKIYFFIIFSLERRIYRDKRQRGRSSFRWFTPQVSATGRYYANPKPGASSGSPTRVQGPKALGCPRLLSRATGRELDGNWSCQD